MFDIAASAYERDGSMARPVGDLTGMDAFAPLDGSSLPVAVLLHGTPGERSSLHGPARSSAADGAVVFVPSWPMLDRPDCADRVESVEVYRSQVVAVVCALRRAKVLAPQLGGDPTYVTLVGCSGGGMVGRIGCRQDGDRRKGARR